MALLKEKQFVYIIGAPRSGTTWLQTMLGAHPQVCTTVELTLFTAYTSPWIRNYAREKSNIDAEKWCIGLPTLWDEDELHTFLRSFLEKAYSKVLAKNLEATHILDKHPGYSLYVHDINTLIPQAKFIHVIRDGRDVTSSMIAAKKNIGFGKGTVEEAARHWKKHVCSAQAAAQYEGRYLEVRYEAMLERGAEILADVFRFCGLPDGDDLVHQIVEGHQFEKMKAKRVSQDLEAQKSKHHYRKGKAGSWREEFSVLDRFLLDQAAGDLLQELEYAEPGWWQQSSSDSITAHLKFLHLRMQNRMKGAIQYLRP